MSRNTQGSTATLPQQTFAPTRRKTSKRKFKFTTIALYASAFVLLMSIVALGYRAPEQSSGVANSSSTEAAASPAILSQPTVNDVVAANIAANVAMTTNLSVADAVANNATSLQIESSLPQAEDTGTSKPPIVELSDASRQIRYYTVQEGDTASSVAAQYNLNAETIKWANNLKTETLKAGQTLEILPSKGIVYTVKQGDSAQSIADKYKADVNILTTYNDLEITGVTPGLKIVIPNGILPDNERPGYIAPVVYNPSAYYGTGFTGNTWFIKRGTPMYDGNTYARGNCTAYAYDRRVELGLAVGARWGNAATWDRAAQGAGLVVNNSPSVGAIMQNRGGYGHVAIVEQIMENGDIKVSEMNASVSGGGYNIVSGRTVPASSVPYYAYIH